MTQAVLPDQMILLDLKWRLKGGVNQRVGMMLVYLLHVCTILSTNENVN
jgi:hypothetical protein